MTSKEPLTYDLSEVIRKNLNNVSGKAANLGELTRNNFPVPNGHVTNTVAYNSFLESNDLRDFIKNSLDKTDYSYYLSVEKFAKVSRQVMTYFQRDSS
nr:PEP/pyruvate-binding domain-containing protein [Candidatus Njordarchaeota archaeon]